MIKVYHIGIYLYGLSLALASLFHKKAKLWHNGQKQVFKQLPAKFEEDIVWVHCASLGEFEQAIPLIQKIKEWKPNYAVLVTFFSPSGFVNAKTDCINYKSYLPLDTKKNANNFLKRVNPKLAIFIKNEFWPNYLKELNKRNIPTISASAIFRSNHIVFNYTGRWLLQILKHLTAIYVQDENSQKLLVSKGFTNTFICGDSRFDRIKNNLTSKKSFPLIEAFKSDKKLIVCGSTYEIDSKMIIEVSRKNPELKFIIAPHEIELSEKLKGDGLLYSQAKDKSLSDFSILIIDSIGILSQLYQYADIAYVGGGFGHNGLHNILEPLAFDVPIIFGPNYQRFSEATEALHYGIAHSINNSNDLTNVIHERLKKTVDKSTISTFCAERSGASKIVFEGIKTHL